MFSLFRRSDTSTDTCSANVGRTGEEIAAAYLRKKGFALLECNYRKRFGEIDIVAREDDTLVFVEVKTRSSERFGTGFEAVDSRKQQRMIKAAQSYIDEKEEHDRSARFDVVSVRLDKGKHPQIEHIRNAFELQT